MAEVPVLALNEALSGISGTISIVSWLFLLLPQLWENYQNQHADGLSIAFLVVWLGGDVTNLAGAVLGDLLPTVIALGIYFCILDFALISQTLYYRLRDVPEDQPTSADTLRERDDPSQPLIQVNNENVDYPPSERRAANAPPPRRRPSAPLPPAPMSDEGVSSLQVLTKNILAVLGVCIVGAAGWAVAWRMEWWKPTSTETDSDSSQVLVAEILGYMSAVLYLGSVLSFVLWSIVLTISSARIPQIYKNHKEKSCEGLSLLFFMLSTLGNGTYGAQILFHSVESRYVLKNLPWLIGSLGTIVEDLIIFTQFHLYSRQKKFVEDSAALVD